MIRCEDLYQVMKRNDFTWFSGVPDSILKEWIDFLNENHGRGLTNRIASIERNAVGWAAGYHIATGKTGVIYTQNSGLGNIVNPVTSLVCPEVYNIPMLLMIGWRGEPGQPDEPQHLKMGEITLPLLDILDIKYAVLPNDISGAEKVISEAREHINRMEGVYALIVRTGTFEPHNVQEEESEYELSREEAIKIIVDSMDGSEIVVSTTGKTSRELFEYREEKKIGHRNDFLMVGSMGLAASFGAEIALQKSARKVFVFDGDGAIIMSAGSLSSIGFYSPKNFYHIVFDNRSHESTGGQPTVSTAVDFKKLALANNYRGSEVVNSREKLKEEIEKIKEKEGPQMLVVQIKKGSRENLGRPVGSLAENKKLLMDFLKE